ncbi:MAG: tol-pal system protein YbgF [Deltaproteobacteria bacterium]|nr:MAG: tol-pal system protein YbgF [Deltaproteobacteria bacterium]
MKPFGGMKTWLILPIGMFVFGWASIRDGQALDRDIDKLHSELIALRKENKSLENKPYSELGTLRKENNSLDNEIYALSDENQKLKTELLFRLETLQSEIRILSTGFEEYKDYLKKSIDRLKEDVAVRTRILEERGRVFEEKNRILEEKARTLEHKNKALEDRARFLEERLKETGDRFKVLEEKMTNLVSKLREVEKPSPPKEAPVEIKGASAGTGVEDLYEDAYETFEKGNLEGARRKFEAFLKQYPNIEFSDNAQFWIGETYYLKKDFEKAILEYEKAIAKYPEGDKVSAALFKQALSFLELGDKTNARNLLKRVVERFPHSAQAEMAKKKLETIK